jgi:plastocyanin domain-containing protein
MIRRGSLVLILFALACKRDETSTEPAKPAPSVAPPRVEGEVKGRRVDVTASGSGFAPKEVKVKQGEPTTLVFTRTTNETCATEVVFPELKLTKDLPLNQPVAIEVPVDAARTLSFECGMGMFKSKLVIE